jgi:hypothetical protein
MIGEGIYASLFLDQDDSVAVLEFYKDTLFQTRCGPFTTENPLA